MELQPARAGTSTEAVRAARAKVRAARKLITNRVYPAGGRIGKRGGLG